MNKNNSILLHGACDKEEYFSDEYPSLSNSNWFPWLQKQLLLKGIAAQTPEIHDAYKPDYSIWKSEFEKHPVNKNTILVGHSCGGGFLTRWLSENKVQLNKLILVAPWLDPDRTVTDNFFDFQIDGKITKRARQVHILVSKDDDMDILQSVDTIKKSLPESKIHKFKDKGHFCYNDLKADAFPELLNLIIE